jgi:hypothetical protein
MADIHNVTVFLMFNEQQIVIQNVGPVKMAVFWVAALCNLVET